MRSRCVNSSTERPDLGRRASTIGIATIAGGRGACWAYTPIRCTCVAGMHAPVRPNPGAPHSTTRAASSQAPGD